jgi:hypothetical protein
MNEENEITKNVGTKRKMINYLIYPRFQLSLILMNLFIFLGGLGVVYYQAYNSFNYIHNLAMKIDISPETSYFKLVGLQKELVFESIITAMILGPVVILVFTLLFSHKSSGAVHRLRTYFLNITENGYKAELDFRDGDMHPDLPEIVNKGIKRIQKDAIEGAKKDKE